ncbi:MAG TPA: type II secretion system F family protein [Alcanivorax sp.]|nr:type II secretion system F family protein [Alcanivorax sp.]
MSPLALLAAAQTLAVLALITVVLQWLWARRRLKRSLNEGIRQRLETRTDLSVETAARVTVTPLESVLIRADIHFSQTQLMVFALIIAVFLLVVAALNGILVAAITAGLIVAALWMYWRFRFQQQRRRIYEELPNLVDTALRYMSAGRSLENALVETFNDAPPVFDPLAFRLRNAVEAGRDYTSLFEDFGGLYRIPSLVLVSIALRTSARFGSSIRPVLTQVATSLRSQQELRREFMSATAETRFTAAAFALLPMGLAAYMILINENYSRVLLDTDTGHLMLAISGGFQGLGIIIIWRMIQGVGRE